MGAYSDFVAILQRRLAEERLSARAAAFRAGLPVRSVRGILEGHVPSLERAEEVAASLGIRFQLGAVERREPPGPSTLAPQQIRALADGVGTLYRVLLIAAVRSKLPLRSLRKFVESHGPFDGREPDDELELFLASGAAPNSFSELANEFAEAIEVADREERKLPGSGHLLTPREVGVLEENLRTLNALLAEITRDREPAAGPRPASSKGKKAGGTKATT